jgi:hypothetical protein
VNVKRKEAPGGRVLESNTAVLEVTVWETPPVFVQQTVVPGAMVWLEGEKAKSTMLTVVSPP